MSDEYFGGMKESILAERSLSFAIQVVKLYQMLGAEKKEFVLSKQILRSGTAVGAMVREAAHGESAADFVHKLAVAQKECNETIYWLIILSKTGYLSSVQYELLQEEATQIHKMITASIKTVKSRNSL
jgi:four helix bundle protein